MISFALTIIGQWVFLNLNLIVMCMDTLPTCIFIYNIHVWCLWKPEAGVGSIKLKLQTLVEVVDAGNQTWVLNHTSALTL